MRGISGDQGHIVMAFIVMAYIVMAYIVMAYIVMAYIVMAYIVMACTSGPPSAFAVGAAPRRARVKKKWHRAVGTRWCSRAAAEVTGAGYS